MELLQSLLNSLGNLGDLTFWISIGRFIIMLSVLIFVHELGHFAVAKWCGIYVSTFSIGFGKRLWGFKIGDTDYRISALPLGGYVKMIGQSDMPDDPDIEQDPEELACPPEKRFDAKPVSARLAVSAAGPFMSLAFGIVVYWVMYMVGVPLPKGMAGTTVGWVKQDSPAATAGLVAGDTILEMDGKRVKTWEDLKVSIIGSKDRNVDLLVQNADGTERTLQVTPRKNEGESFASIGVNYLEEFTVAGVYEGMPAEAAGIREGDLIIGLKDPEGQTYPVSGMQELVKEHAGKPVTFSIRRPAENGAPTEFDLPVSPTRVTQLVGLEIEDGLVRTVYGQHWEEMDGSSAPREGDRVVSINGQTLSDEHPETLQTVLANSTGTAPVTLARANSWGEGENTWTIDAPTQVRGLIGITYNQDTKLYRYSASEAVPLAIDRFWTTVDQTVRTFAFIFRGDVSPRELGGPIMIADVSSQVYKFGWGHYLNLVGLITVNLGILNLLPVPVLDGGHMLIFAIEGIRRRPLNPKALYYAQHVGLALLLFLMVFATFNDLWRIVQRIVG